MMGYLGPLLAIVRKDIMLELRTKDIVVSVLVFSILVIVIFNFAIDPTGSILLAANQDSDSIVTFHIDQQSGELHPTGDVTEVPMPVCVKLAPLA